MCVIDDLVVSWLYRREKSTSLPRGEREDVQRLMSALVSNVRLSFDAHIEG